MKRMMFLLGLAVALLSGCKKPEAKPVVVFAAAGTAPAMKEIAALFEKETGARVRFNFANAGVLAKQLGSGAAADLFFSANEKWMDFAADKGVIRPETRVDLLSNRLVVVEPRMNTNRRDFRLRERMQSYRRVAVGDPVTPVGIYTEQALSKCGCWACVASKACRGDTVQKVLNFVALGEADAGVVFQSVAVCSADKVDLVGVIPAELHKPIRFPVAACSGVTADGLKFLAFLKSAPAGEIFEKFGWNVIGRGEAANEPV